MSGDVVFFVWVIFKKAVKTAVPDDGQTPGTSVPFKGAMLVVLAGVVIFGRKSIKTAVQDDGRPPEALVLTKLIK